MSHVFPTISVHKMFNFAANQKPLSLGSQTLMALNFIAKRAEPPELPLKNDKMRVQVM